MLRHGDEEVFIGGTSFKSQVYALYARNVLLYRKQRVTVFFQIFLPALLFTGLFITTFTLNKLSEEGQNTVTSDVQSSSTYLATPRQIPVSFRVTEGTNVYNVIEVVNATSFPIESIFSQLKKAPYPSNMSGFGEFPLFLFTEGTVEDAVDLARPFVSGRQPFEFGKTITGVMELLQYSDAEIVWRVLGPAIVHNVPYSTSIDCAYGFIHQGQVIGGLINLATNIALSNLVSNATVLTTYVPTAALSTGKERTVRSNTARVISILYPMMMPFGLSFFIPVVLSGLVKEKEAKLFEVMQMSGLQLGPFWFVTTAFDFTLFLPNVFVAVLGAYLTDLTTVTETSAVIWIVTYILWAPAMLSMTYFFSTFFYSTTRATVFGYFLYFAAIGSGIVVNTFVLRLEGWQYLYCLWPPVAVSRPLFLMSSAYINVRPLEAADILPPNELGYVLSFVLLDIVVYGALAFLLTFMFPSKGGAVRWPCLTMKCCSGRCCRGASHVTTMCSRSCSLCGTTTTIMWDPDAELYDEEDDCESERATAMAASTIDSHAIVVQEVSVVFPGMSRPALDRFSLSVPRGECMALLGPNGAGKSTLIGLVTGILTPLSGEIYVGGFSVHKELNKVYDRIGIVPQFNILWKDLQVYEQMTFFARIRGVASAAIDTHVDLVLDRVGLRSVKTSLTETLSEGMKRRLSIGIALIGSPEVLILDEPTTGLDPLIQREIWDLLRELQTRCAILLTTHSMEEALYLSNRIAIMSNGRLRCIGTHTDLTTRHGHNLKIRLRIGDDDKVIAVARFMTKHFPSASLEQRFSGVLVFSIPKEAVEASKLIASLEKNKRKLAIRDWDVSGTSLGEVFSNIVAEDEVADFL